MSECKPLAGAPLEACDSALTPLSQATNQSLAALLRAALSSEPPLASDHNSQGFPVCPILGPYSTRPILEV